MLTSDYYAGNYATNCGHPLGRGKGGIRTLISLASPPPTLFEFQKFNMLRSRAEHAWI